MASSCFNHRNHHLDPARRASCAALLTPPRTYPHPLPPCTILTGVGSQPPEEAAQNDAGRLKYRRHAHHKGKHSPFPLLLTPTMKSRHERRWRIARLRDGSSKSARPSSYDRTVAPTVAIENHLVLFHSFPARRPEISTCSSSPPAHYPLLPPFPFLPNSTAPFLPRHSAQPQPLHTLLPPLTRPLSSPSPSSSS